MTSARRVRLGLAVACLLFATPQRGVADTPREAARAAYKLAGAVRAPFEGGVAAANVHLYRIDGQAGEGAGAATKTVAGEFGDFEFGGLTAGQYRVHVLLDGYSTADSTVWIGPGAPRWPRLWLELRRSDAVDVTVEVLDADGSPVIEAQVVGQMTPLADSSRQICTTDRHGRCVLEGLPRGKALLTEVRHPDFPPLEAVSGVRVDPEDPRLTLWMPCAPWRWVRVEGEIRGPTGGPIKGARIEIGDPTQHAPRTQGARTGSDGRFVLPRVKQGAYWMTVEADGFAGAISRFKASPDAEPLFVEMSRGATLTGRILGTTSVSVDGLAVHASAADEQTGEKIYQWVGYPRPDGQGRFSGERYSIAHVAAGYFQVWTRLGDEIFAAPCRVREGQTIVVCDLQRLQKDSLTFHFGGEGTLSEPRAIRVMGRVVDEAGGAPLGDAKISALGAEAISSPDGRFELEGTVRLAEVEMRAGLPGYVDTEMMLRVDAVEGVRVPLRRAVGLRYTVESHDGPPIDRAFLRLLGTDGTILDHNSIDDDPQGVWSQVPAGEYVLQVHAGSGFLELPIEVPGPPLSLVIPPGGSVSVRVPDLELDFGDGWLDGVVTELVPLVTSAGALPHRGERQLGFAGVQPGIWRIEVRAPGGRSWVGQVDIEDRRHTRVILD